MLIVYFYSTIESTEFGVITRKTDSGLSLKYNF